MGEIIKMQRVDLPNVDLRWLLGRSVVGFLFHEPSLWVISFSGGGYVQTDGIWRVLVPDAMPVVSCDHGHQFGLPKPLDAAALATAQLSGSAIVEARIDGSAPDLIIRFANGATLQVLATSLGYECWIVCDPAGVCCVVNGSREASTWKEKRPG